MKGSNVAAWALAAAVAGGWTYYEQQQANGSFSKSEETDRNGKVLEETPQTAEAKKTLKAMRKAQKEAPKQLSGRYFERRWYPQMHR